MSAYIALDGPDGCGKSSQALQLSETLRERGLDVVHLREPGSTPFGEQLRAALLDARSGMLDPLSEALAFSAARREMLLREVAPALARDAVVVAERCFVSTAVYQGYAPERGAVDIEVLSGITAAVHAGIWPDLLLVLDLPAEAARGRLSGGLDRIEALGEPFHARVRRGFVEAVAPDSWLQGLLRRQGDPVDRPRALRIDASQPIEQVHAAVLAAVDRCVPTVGGQA